MAQYIENISLNIATDLFTNVHQISQAAHVIELFHGSRKVFFEEDWISSELDLEDERMKATINTKGTSTSI